MYQVIIVVHVLLGLGVVGLVLMQQGKGADAGAAFGTGSSGSVFGAQGAASFLSRATAILATLFFMTSLGLAVLNSKQGAAYDLMNAPKVEQDTLGIPDVNGAKGAGSASPRTDVKSEEVPVAAPAASGAEQAIEKK
ncbi:MAG: preprotein translocase subunit SecG [Methylobacter sp.]